MVFVKSWEDFEIAAENMYMANPMTCRYTMKYVHTKGHILMKMTDNVKEWLRMELTGRHLMLPKISEDNKVCNCAFVTWTGWDFGTNHFN